jgi:hypothetical protein
MNEQLSFTIQKPLYEQFKEFHEANPEVFVALEDMAQTLISRGRKKIGISLLIEVLRWNYYMKTDDPNSDFKINNNYRSFYARLLIESHPEWAEVFELRHLRSA